jgi:rod shape-determining protein MreD
MTARQIFTALPMFLAVYVFQEAVVNQFRLPAGGFSLFLIFTLVWAILSTPEVSALAGFFGGLLMDFSQSSSGPIGQWTLLMIAASYSVAYFGSGHETLSGSPLGFTFLTTAAVFLVEFAYVFTGLLFGLQIGNFSQITITIVGISIWSLVVTPIVLPIFSRLHAYTFDTRSMI